MANYAKRDARAKWVHDRLDAVDGFVLVGTGEPECECGANITYAVTPAIGPAVLACAQCAERAWAKLTGDKQSLFCDE